MLNCNICVYGASVTEQGGNSGFFFYLKNDLQVLIGDIDINISRISFPSASFNDAGFLFIDSFLFIKPDFLILDWLSTAEFEFDEDKLISFLTRVLKKKIFPIIVDLPRQDSIVSRRWNSLQARRIAENFNIGYLDITGYCADKGLDIFQITRDGVHSNEYGAKLYSEKIAAALAELIFTGDYIDKCRYEINLDLGLRVNSIDLFQPVVMRKNEQLSFQLFPISTSTRINNVLVEIWALQVVGVFSPIIKIECAELDFVDEINIWDMWCHYDRIAFKPLLMKLSIPSKSNGEGYSFSLKVSERVPDYSTVKREDVTFPVDRYLKLVDSIKLINCNVVFDIL